MHLSVETRLERNLKIVSGCALLICMPYRFEYHVLGDLDLQKSCRYDIVCQIQIQTLIKRGGGGKFTYSRRSSSVAQWLSGADNTVDHCYYGRPYSIHEADLPKYLSP